MLEGIIFFIKATLTYIVLISLLPCVLLNVTIVACIMVIPLIKPFLKISFKIAPNKYDKMWNYIEYSIIEKYKVVGKMYDAGLIDGELDKDKKRVKRIIINVSELWKVIKSYSYTIFDKIQKYIINEKMPKSSILKKITIPYLITVQNKIYNEYVSFWGSILKHSFGDFPTFFESLKKKKKYKHSFTIEYKSKNKFILFISKTINFISTTIQSIIAHILLAILIVLFSLPTIFIGVVAWLLLF